jgi:hypothetical protein
MGHHGFACEHRSKSIEFELKIRVVRAFSHGHFRVSRRNNYRDMVR